MPEQSPTPELRYALNEWPPPLATLVLSLQWLAVLLSGLLVLGEVLAAAQGLDAQARVELLQRLLLMGGLVQAAQVLWGHRLPGLVGPSTVLLVGALGTLDAGEPAVYGAMAVGGMLTAMVGASGLAGRLGRLYTPPVLASTLILLIVSLAPTMRDLFFSPGPGGGTPAQAFTFGLGLILVMFWAQHHLKGLLGSAVLLLGLVLGTAAYYLLNLGSLPPGGPALTGAWGLPRLWPVALDLDPGVVAAFALCYLALIANELGSVESLGPLTGAQGMPGRASRAVLVSGLGGLLAGLWGVPGPVTYSGSPGVLFSSRSASRFTLLPAAALVVGLALWPQGLALMHMVPPAVVGAVLFVLMANGFFAALHLLQSRPGGADMAAGLVVGASVTAGLVVTFMPPGVRESLPALARPLLANGFVVGLVLALILEHLILVRRRQA